MLIIREALDPNRCTYDYDLAEHNVLLYDWGNYMAEDNLPGIQSLTRITPQSILINGQGSYHDFSSNTHKFAPMAAFYVQRGKRHRFRFVNTGSHPCPFGVTVCNILIIFFALHTYILAHEISLDAFVID